MVICLKSILISSWPRVSHILGLLVASFGYRLACSSVSCVSCNLQVTTVPLTIIPSQCFWQEYIVDDNVEFTWYHMTHVPSGCHIVSLR
jgi:hypothetical protein